jgi:RsiW-degrading membrane proteinase PrsW (M82 family)
VNILGILIFIFVVFLPPLIYVIWIRNTEKYNREKWIPIFICFFWGATIAVIAAFILEVILHFSIFPDPTESPSPVLISAIVIAPFVEEFTKPLVLNFNIVKKELVEIEDGFIYGACAGLGFSATENLIYGFDILKQGLIFFIILIAIRSIGGCFLHASASAWTGYGYGKFVMNKTSFLKVIPYFIIAVILHSLYNTIVSIDIIGAVLALFAALFLAIISIVIVRKKIIKYDNMHP